MEMFSLIAAICSATFWLAVSSLPGHFSLRNSSTFAAWLCATAFATSSANLRKFSLRPTKSVSQFTSTSTPVSPATCATTAPSAVMRPAFLLAAARPFLRRILTASSLSPLASVSAAFTSPNPAPVCSRSSLIMAGVMLISTPRMVESRGRAGSPRPNQSQVGQSDRRSGLHLGSGGFGGHRLDRGLVTLVLGSDVALLGEVVALEDKGDE